jgi:hypothetical protein
MLNDICRHKEPKQSREIFQGWHQTGRFKKLFRRSGEALGPAHARRLPREASLPHSLASLSRYLGHTNRLPEHDPASDNPLQVALRCCCRRLCFGSARQTITLNLVSLHDFIATTQLLAAGDCSAATRCSLTNNVTTFSRLLQACTPAFTTNCTSRVARHRPLVIHMFHGLLIFICGSAETRETVEP